MPANLPYPLQFDPSQMKNPYTKWAGQALPFYGAGPSPAGEFGGTVPTDAMGNPIQSYVDANTAAQADYQAQQAAYQKALGAYNAGQPQGTTINNTGGSAGAGGGTIDYSKLGEQGPAIQQIMNNYQTAQAKLTPQQQYNQAQAAAVRNQNLSQMNMANAMKASQGGFGNSAGGAFNAGQVYSPVLGIGGGVGGAPAAPAGPAPPTPPTQPDMTAAYIKALQNPGHITTPGATVAQSALPAQQSNVLQNFLAGWNGNTKGAGNYDNSGFFNGLEASV